MKEILSCDYCGKEFKRIPSQIRINKNHFCSRKCYGNWASVNRIKNKSPNYKSDRCSTKEYKTDRSRKYKLKEKNRLRTYNQKYNFDHRDEYREWRLKKKFNITSVQYNKMSSIQGDMCLICKKHIDELGYRLVIDHNHRCCPGEETCGTCIRGLLCRNCNLMLGMANDSPDLLIIAADYIKQYIK